VTWPLGLRAVRAVTTRLPPLPRMLGLAKRVAFPLARGAGPRIARVRGFRMELDPEDLVEGLLLFAPHLYDRREIRALEEALVPGDTFLDLGSHVRFYALVASGVVGPSGCVLAVEPDPRSRAKLVRNLDLNAVTNTFVSEVGVSDRSETRVLHLGPPDNRGASSLIGDAPGPTIACEPVPALLAVHAITDVAAAKLDLEGYDSRVLRAWLAPLALDRRPRLLVVERRADRADPTDVSVLLRELGYRIRRGGRDNVIATRVSS